MKYKSVSLLILLLFFHKVPAQSTDAGGNTEEGYKEINGARIYYHIIGKGEPLLIVHGGPGMDQGYLFPQLKTLAAKYQLIFYDQRLSGKSSPEADSNSISLDGFADDIEGLRIQLKLDKINILAHSFGGLFAMHYCLKYPEHVSTLMLIGSVSANSALNAVSEKMLLQRRTMEDSIQRAIIIQSSSFKDHEAVAYEGLFRLGFKHQFFNPAYLDSLYLELPDDFYLRSQSLQYLRKDLGNYDFHDELKKIKCPVLLVYGDYDPLAAVVARSFQNDFPDSKLVILQSCGHFPFIEKPGEFRQTIVDFLKKP